MGEWHALTCPTSMRTLVRQLRRWQRREWLYRAAWGFARLGRARGRGAGRRLSSPTGSSTAIVDTPFRAPAAHDRRAARPLRRGRGTGSSSGSRCRRWIDASPAGPRRRSRSSTTGSSPPCNSTAPGRRPRGCRSNSSRGHREAEAMSARHRLASAGRPARGCRVAPRSSAVPVLLAPAGSPPSRPDAGRRPARPAVPLAGGHPAVGSSGEPDARAVAERRRGRAAVRGHRAGSPTTRPGRVRVFPEGQPAETFPLTLGRSGSTRTRRLRRQAAAVVGAVHLPRPAGRRPHPRRPGRGPVRAAAGRQRGRRLGAAAGVRRSGAGSNRYERFQPQGEVLAVADSRGPGRGDDLEAGGAGRRWCCSAGTRPGRSSRPAGSDGRSPPDGHVRRGDLRPAAAAVAATAIEVADETGSPTPTRRAAASPSPRTSRRG